MTFDRNLTTMRRQPKQKRSQERVEKILKAAAEVFIEVGYEAATTHTIAARAGTAIGSLYQFFPDKLAIFHALEVCHMEQVTAVNAKLLVPEITSLPIEQFIQIMVETHAAYFQNPIPRIVYLQYFITPEMFQLFDDRYVRQLIETMANLLRSRNPTLNPQKCELMAEVCHYCYNTVLLQALRSDEAHQQKLYEELQALLVSYLKPHVEPVSLEGNPQIENDKVMKVMICPRCNSNRISKNGHRHGKQRFICKDCDRQFLH
ncbi:TetR/AcrR family transcriptional regulator [Tumidithrix elongata]|uniref:TetR/AcrR family transcriptional regulator n=1 Tax=Tumidithrix elongata TaxID=3088357 RepID=UPI0038CD9DC4